MTPTNRNNGVPLPGGKLDPRLGVILRTTKQEIVLDSQDPAIVVASGVIGSRDVSPKTKDAVIAETTYVPTLPADIVAYGVRDASFLPDTLDNVTLVGTEDIAFSYQTSNPPIGGLMSRITYKFFEGPPPQSAIPRLTYFRPSLFVGAFEYTRTKNISTTGTSTDQSGRTGTENSNRTSSDTSSRSSTDVTNSNGTESTTHNSSDSSTGSSTDQTNSVAQTNEVHTSQRTHDTTGSGSGTSHSTSVDSYNNNNTITSTGTNTSAGTGTSTTTDTNQTRQTQQHELIQGQESRTVTDSGGAPLVSDETTSAAFIRESNANITTTTSGGTSNTSSTTHSTTDDRNSTDTVVGTSSRVADGTSNTTHTGHETLSLSSNGTTNSTSTGTHNTNRTASQHTIVNSDSTRSGSNTNVSTSNGTSNVQGTSSTTFNGQTTSNSVSQSTSAHTGKEVLVVHIPPTLHGNIHVSNGVIDFTIPATIPPDLPSGWITLLANPWHWEAGIWVLEIHEVFLPDQ